MKTLKIVLSILIVATISVSSYSQDLQPKKVTLGTEKGVFINFALMDTITVKLIEKKSLIVQNKTLASLYLNEKQIVKTKDDKIKIFEENALKYDLLNSKSEIQIKLLEENFETQKEETKKARRNGLKLFSGGLLIGASAVAIFALIN
ncbi:hypothetical protein [Flavobacterium phage FPSV-S1]|nr:hypothetical protein [Flavobacterium phage FPSV-S1]QCW20500.1 hypothetical protein [Flavobacterium phage FPSV-S8]